MHCQHVPVTFEVAIAAYITTRPSGAVSHNFNVARSVLGFTR